MKVKFWGTRGSIATPEPEYMRYGGNTACVEVRAADGELIILDAGTGIRRLGQALLAEAAGPRQGSLIISHFHWDHIQGFPFFAPLYVPGWSFSIYGQFKVDHRLMTALSGQMGNLYFPVSMEAFNAEVSFEELIEQEFKIGATRITSRALNHPQGNLGFRLNDGEGVFAYVTDTEHPEEGLDPKVLELAQGADVLVYDAQFTPALYPERKGWGHSTWEVGVELARAAGVGKLVLFHHDPAATDEAIDAIVAEASAALPGTIAASRDLELVVKRDGPVARPITAEISTTVRQRLKTSIAREGDEVLVTPASFLSTFSSPEFKDAVSAALAEEGVRGLSFDLSDTPHLDSAALATLATFLEMTEAIGARFAIRAANRQILEALSVTRFDQLVELPDAPAAD